MHLHRRNQLLPRPKGCQPLRPRQARREAERRGSAARPIYYYNTPLIRPRRGDSQHDAKNQRCRPQQRFFNTLRFIPNLTFKLGHFQRLLNGGQVEKGVEVMLAIDMLTLASKDRYNVAIPVPSDADYKCAIEAVMLPSFDGRLYCFQSFMLIVRRRFRQAR